jgi:hypothetical protein
MTTPDPFAPGYRLTDGSTLNYEIANPTWSTSQAVTATPGGTALNSTKIVNAITNVTVATASGAGVVLPQALPGKILLVINNSANDIRVFAEGSSTIDGLAGAIGVLQQTAEVCMYIGSAVDAWDQLVFLPTGFSGYSQGSVIFGGAAGNLSQDNANFFWDNTNDRLGIGTNTPTGDLDIYKFGVEFVCKLESSLAKIGAKSNHPLVFLANNVEVGRFDPTTGRLLLAQGQYGSTTNTHNFYDASSTQLAQISTSGLTLYGSGSNAVTISDFAVSGTYSFNLPATAGSVGQVLKSGGGGAGPMTWSSLEPVSVLDYGADKTGATNCATAFTNANAAPSILIPSGTYLVSSNVTFTKDVTILPGATLNISNGVTVTFSGGMQAEKTQIFNTTGTGVVVFNEELVTTGYPEWWGGFANDLAIDCSVPINKCITACPVTELGIGNYYVSSRVWLNKTNRSLVGLAYGYQGDNTNTTQIVATNGSTTIVQMGPDADPGAINSYLQGTRIANVNLNRTVGPISTSGSGIGLINKFTLFTQINTVSSQQSMQGFYLYATVQTRLTECYASRSLAKSGGAPADQFIGYYLDGNSPLPAAGGNASTYFTDCGAGCFLPALQTSGSTGLALDKAGADTFVLRFESVTCAIGIEIVGTEGLAKDATGDVDIHILGAVIDQFASYGIRIIKQAGGGAITVIDGYFAPTGGSGATAGIAIDSCVGTISLTDNQVIGFPNNIYGLLVQGTLAPYYASQNINSKGNIFLNCARGAIHLTSTLNSIFTDTCRNTSTTSANAAITLTSGTGGGCSRCYIASIVSGGVNTWAQGVRLIGTSATYCEVNVTSVLPSCISGGAGNKLTYNSTQITAVGVFGTTNYCSGAVG